MASRGPPGESGSTAVQPAPAPSRQTALVAADTEDRAGELVVYTDGACRGNPGPGGWAWAVPGGAYASGAEPHTTNQRMEITAVVRALEAVPGPVLVRSDSTYVVNCFRDRWYVGWQRRNWRNAANRPVANRDLWEPLLDLVLHSERPVRLQWVKGHGADPMNHWVDQLATEAADRQVGTSGGTEAPGAARASRPAPGSAQDGVC